MRTNNGYWVNEYLKDSHISPHHHIKPLPCNNKNMISGYDIDMDMDMIRISEEEC